MSDFRHNGVHYWEDLEPRLETKPMERIGISTGFRRLDYVMRGFHNGKLYVVSARPGDGKTSFCTSIVAGCLRQELTAPILYFSTELDEFEILDQVVEAASGGTPIYPNGRILKVHEKERIKKSVDWLKDRLTMRRLYVEHSRRFSVSQIAQKTAEFCDGYHLGAPALVIVDQASRVSRDDAGGRRSYAQATEDMLNGFEAMTSEMQVPILLMAQANRDAAKGGRPKMSQIKHSGAFEEYAHFVAMLEKQDDDNSGDRIWIDKNRHGMVCNLEARFHGEAHTWEIMDNG